MDNQTEKKMESEMQTGFTLRLLGFPKLGVPVWRVPIMRIIAYWGLYGVACFGKPPNPGGPELP